ncbi:MAG: carbohydrate binding domain-containing protein [Candidatus Sumerlaeota bacterium]|nr:carbohydrate binding domain-containing protein [Candidatus Sumerlaeota bacterium]
MKASLLLSLLGCLGSLFIPFASAAETERIKNGDFENQSPALSGWKFWARDSKSAAEITKEAHGGQGAAHIRNTGAREWNLTNEAHEAVKPGQIFTVTANAKGKGSVTLAVTALSGGKAQSPDINTDSLVSPADWSKLLAEARIPEGCEQIQIRFFGTGLCDLLLDDVTIQEGASRPRLTKPPVEGFARERVRDKMGRGLAAMPAKDGGVYLGWRMLSDDPKDIAFNVYRSLGAEKAKRLNPEPLIKTTNFVDAAAPQGDNRYSVRAIVNGSEKPESESEQISFTSSAGASPYISIKLQGNYDFQKVAIADLDGDGRFDFVIKQPNYNVDPYVNYWKKSQDTFKLEAYRSDGKFLWRYDMGWAIEEGMWYSPYIVYDFDGDGRAEVAVKAGEGDPRDADGRVTTGLEYLLIMDGATGKEKTRAPWPSREGYPDYNYYCRNQLGLAYLDGKTPCLLVERGTYNTIKMIAYEFHDGKLRELWAWNDREEGGAYRGQGAHCLRAADVDGDGRDEVIIGSAVLDDNGKGLWCTRLGHPDHLTVGDLDPARPGLEIQYGIEPRQRKNAICMVEARTGKILWGLDEPTSHVHSSGLCADIDPKYPGAESYGGERDDKNQRWLFSATGKLIAKKDLGGLAPRAAYWDADMQRELVTKEGVHKYNSQSSLVRIEGAVIAITDFLGDWREEIITALPGEMRIYSTTIPAADRRPCLMQDPIYRIDVAVGSQGYYQIPGLSILPGAETK